MTEKANHNSKEQDKLLNGCKKKGLSQTLLLKTKSSRLVFMLLLIMIYFFAEVIVGTVACLLFCNYFLSVMIKAFQKLKQLL